jgi:hypothetical protein
MEGAEMICTVFKDIGIEWCPIHNVDDWVDIDVYLTMRDKQEYKTRVSKGVGTKAAVEDPVEYLYSVDGHESFEEPDHAPPVQVVLAMCHLMPTLRDYIAREEARRLEHQARASLNPEAARLYTAAGVRIEQLEGELRQAHLTITELNNNSAGYKNRIFELERDLAAKIMKLQELEAWRKREFDSGDDGLYNVRSLRKEVREARAALKVCDGLLRKYRYVLPKNYTRVREELDAALKANKSCL